MKGISNITICKSNSSIVKGSDNYIIIKKSAIPKVVHRNMSGRSRVHVKTIGIS